MDKTGLEYFLFPSEKNHLLLLGLPKGHLIDLC